MSTDSYSNQNGTFWIGFINFTFISLYDWFIIDTQQYKSLYEKFVSVKPYPWVNFYKVNIRMLNLNSNLEKGYIIYVEGK